MFGLRGRELTNRIACFNQIIIVSFSIFIHRIAYSIQQNVSPAWDCQHKNPTKHFRYGRLILRHPINHIMYYFEKVNFLVSRNENAIESTFFSIWNFDTKTKRRKNNNNKKNKQNGKIIKFSMN